MNKEIRNQRIIALRKKGWTQQAIADRYNLSQSTVFQIIKNNMKNAKHTNSLIDPEEVYHEEAPESHLVHLVWLIPGALLVLYLLVG